MRVTRLALDHYRSWTQCLVDFDKGMNVLVGRNGLGKTNIVEAIEVLSTGASPRASARAPLVERGHERAVVRAHVVADANAGAQSSEAGGSGRKDAENAGEGATYALTIPAKGSARVRVDGGKSLYLHDIAGQIPSVSFTPSDQLLVVADPARRRTFLDMAGAQLSPSHYHDAQNYAHVASQRAAILKHLAASRAAGTDIRADLANLETWTARFIDSGITLTFRRAAAVNAIAADFARIYREISGGGEAGLEYAPGFGELAPLVAAPPSSLPTEVRIAIGKHFQRLYEGEVAQGRNLIGPHKDELVITLDGMPARDYASNGESWSLALALKMDLYEVIAARGETPILILDDVFAQLDDARRTQIIGMATKRGGQTLITAASPSDIPQETAAHVIDVAEIARRSTEGTW